MFYFMAARFESDLSNPRCRRTAPCASARRCGLLGVGSDTIARDDHEVTTQKTVAHHGLDAAVGGTADHHDRCRPTVAENRFEFVADEHARPSFVEDDIVFSRPERLHDLPAEAPMEAAWFELAWMVDLFVFHLPAHPGR